jgi:hypothetical protein
MMVCMTNVCMTNVCMTNVCMTNVSSHVCQSILHNPLQQIFVAVALADACPQDGACIALLLMLQCCY